jgi:hypothetical protein
LAGGGAKSTASIQTIASRFHLRRLREKIAEFGSPKPIPWTGCTTPEKRLFDSGEILSKKVLF